MHMLVKRYPQNLRRVYSTNDVCQTVVFFSDVEATWWEMFWDKRNGATCQ